MLTRRDFVTCAVVGTAAVSAAVYRGIKSPSFVWAEDSRSISERAIPSSGEMIPVIGMGTSGSFEVGEASQDRERLREVLRRFVDGGGTVIDTAPSYSTAETVLGDLLADGSQRKKLFLATKLSSYGRDAGLGQFESSLKRLRTESVDLLQVHNLGDWKTQLALARELKAEGRVRYVGLTHYLDRAHEELAEIVQAEKPDFLQINYSVVSRNAEKRVFPVARDKGVAVLVNRTFEDGKLFSQVAGKELPEWAGEIGITSWAQAFLRFALSVPAVTAVIPATGKPERQTDNLRAGTGPVLTQEHRTALIAAVA